MESILPPWIVDVASVSSIAGLAIAILLLIEAKKIRKSFLRRARLPEVNTDLNKKSKIIFSSLKAWDLGENIDVEKNTVNEQYAITRGLLENISTKLPEEERSEVLKFINSLRKRRYLFWWGTLIIADKEEGWKLYTELSRIITRLDQLQKDFRWD